MEILERLNIPLIDPQRIPIRTLIVQLNPTKDDKKIIESHISSMKLVSLLNQQTIRLRPYTDNEISCQTIYVIDIKLKKEDSIVSLSNIVHSAFPEPTILLLGSEKNNYISVSEKRINKLDKTKTVVENVLLVKIDNLNISYINFNNDNFSNLFTYYKNIISNIEKIEVFNITNIYPKKEVSYRTMIAEYEKIKSSISNLKEKYKQATMKSQKLIIDDKIYDEEEKMKEVISKIKGE